MDWKIPEELIKHLPKQTLDLDWHAGPVEVIRSLPERLGEQMGELLRKGLEGMTVVVLILFFASLAETLFSSAGGKGKYVSLASAAAILVPTAGSVDRMMGLGQQTMVELDQFSKVLLPVLTSAMAAMGCAGGAAVRQVSTVFVCELLVTLINRLILPLIWLYAAALSAGAMLSDGRLMKLAAGIKKAIVWLLGGILTLFTLYLTMAGVIAGSADAAAVRTAKKVVSGAVPVVGGILSAAAETVLAGAGVLKNTVGAFGVLAVLAVCIIPFLRLGVEYLLFKAAALLTEAFVPPPLAALVDGLGGVFGLLLGTVGSCAVALLVSLLSALLVVTA